MSHHTEVFLCGRMIHVIDQLLSQTIQLLLWSWHCPLVVQHVQLSFHI